MLMRSGRSVQQVPVLRVAQRYAPTPTQGMRAETHLVTTTDQTHERDWPGGSGPVERRPHA